MSLALRHIQVAPDYRISIITRRNPTTGGWSKIRVHKRKIRQAFRTILAQVSLPRHVTFRRKLR